MDFKYIEALLDRYWEGETSLQEEEELRFFFTGHNDLPVHLKKYKSLFVYQVLAKQEELDDAFDEKLLALIKAPVVKAEKITFFMRMKPFLKAVAMITAVLAISNVTQYIVKGGKSDYNYDNYVETYDDPEVAYEQLSVAFRMLSEEISANNLVVPDTLAELNAAPDIRFK